MTQTPPITPVLTRRRAGILLHPTSLPAPYGALGQEARRFIDFLAEAGMSVWQMLPVCPTHGDSSPYQSPSANAGNPLLIDLQELVHLGLLQPGDLFPDACGETRRSLLAKAATAFFHPADHAGDPDLTSEYEQFIQSNQSWLNDYALFETCRSSYGNQPWTDWPQQVRDRDTETLVRIEKESQDVFEHVLFEQFMFDRQWQAIRRYGVSRGVYLYGDIPIFIAHNSVDVWAHRDLFKVDSEGHPTVIAGVPPDYFSHRGQHWGNPLYNWNAMASNGFAWWLTRLEVQQRLFDLIRIDHFRGLVACWEIPAETPEPACGQWVGVPGREFLEACFTAIPDLPLVAENLGLIGEDVETLRHHFHLPGMTVLHFGFDGSPDNPHLFHNHTTHDLVYTGTHDNDTTLGWYLSLDDHARNHVDRYTGNSNEPMPWRMIRMAFQSVSRLAVVPMQDVLGLDGSARLNTPGTASGNWMWQFQWNQIDATVAPRLRELLALYGRQHNDG